MNFSPASKTDHFYLMVKKSGCAELRDGFLTKETMMNDHFNQHDLLMTQDESKLLLQAALMLFVFVAVLAIEFGLSI